MAEKQKTITGAQKTRQEAEQRYTWRLEDFFETDELFQKEFDDLAGKLPEFEKFRGTLSNSAEALESFLSFYNDYGMRMERIYTYAHMRLSEDSGNSTYSGLADSAATLASKLDAATAFFTPELLSIDEEKLNGFLSTDLLRPYAHLIDNIVRNKEHTLSPELEEMLAQTGDISRTAQGIFQAMSYADMKYGNIIDEDGSEVELTLPKYSNLMQSKNRELRKTAYFQLMGEKLKFKNTWAAAYAGSVKKDMFYAKARKFNSCIEGSLANSNVPKSVYDNLITAVHEYLPALHRYYALRKKRLGLDEIAAYDMQVPIVADADTKMEFEQAKTVISEALACLGKEYGELLEKSYAERWIDVYDNAGKDTGAYSWGAYLVHPYILMNYAGKIGDMFTLAHEEGHAMHRHYSIKNQPYMYYDCVTFTAEVASTVNEALLVKHLLKTIEDKVQKEYILSFFINEFVGTVFRQAQFAEFEAEVHRRAEAGEPVSLAMCNEVYGKLNREYYGEGVMLPEGSEMSWASIPHFYTPFYVYQYATGFSAAIAFSDIILNGGEKELNDYLTFLKSGSNDYPIEILKKAGVDMYSPEPVRKALKIFEELISEMEQM